MPQKVLIHFWRHAEIEAELVGEPTTQRKANAIKSQQKDKSESTSPDVKWELHDEILSETVPGCASGLQPEGITHIDVRVTYAPLTKK
jgi:hypothetical protein